MAKDLREEFYPYFQSFLNRLVLLLRTQDSDQLEWTLICLAYLFKTLKPFLKKDITIIFNSIIPLLDKRNPEHITNFAAECFSFVARDIKDKDKFLALVLNGLRKHKNGVIGCGRLLFEMMRGVHGNLHSCSEEFLMTLLTSLHSTTDQELLFEVLTSCVFNLLQNTNPTGMQIFWDVSHRVLRQMLDTDNITTDLDNSIRKLLTLMGQGIEFRNGKLLCGADTMITSLIRVCDCDVSETTLLVTSQIISVLLLSPNLIITQLDASRVCKKILTVPHREVFEAFVWNIVKYSQFELLVLPEFLRYFETNPTDMSALELLTKIILEKSPISRDGISLSDWRQFPLRFRQEATIKHIENMLLSANVNAPAEPLVMALIIYPHVIGVSSDANVQEKLQNLIEELSAALRLEDEPLAGKEIDEYLENKRLFFILSNLIECCIHIGQGARLNRNSLVTMLLPYCQDTKYILALNILDQLITIADAVKFKEYQEIHEKIADNLASQYHRLRLLTAHILLKFGNLDELNQSTMDTNIYAIFYNVESITANVQTYREQLLLLQKLAPDMQLFLAIQDTPCAVDPLR